MADLFARVDVDGSTIRFVMGDAIRSTGLVTDDLTLNYGDLDLTHAPIHVLTIPGLLNLAPVVWYSGIAVTVPFYDEALAQGLKEIQARFQEMYPEAPWAGAVGFEGPAVPPSEPAGRSAMLFSGGLDSVSSATRHLDEGIELITVGGADMESADEASWRGLRADVKAFATAYGTSASFVNGNIKECLNTVRLSNMAPLTKYGISYWGGVQHGLALSGLTAPIAWAKGIDKLYLASSFTEEFWIPWGSGPDIDNHIAWSGFRVEHDGFEISRQQKLERLVEFCERTGLPRPNLRVCTSTFGDRSKNCGRCEKCLRTQAGLLAEGENPRDWGFDADREQSAARIAQAFKTRTIVMQDDELFMWSDVRKRALVNPGCDKGLRVFIEAFDPAEYRAKSNARQRFVVPLKAALSRMPFAYKIARRAALRIKHRRASRL